MSVLIKGMEMPKNCGECQFCHTEFFTEWCCPTGREDVSYDSVPQWCSLDAPVKWIPCKERMPDDLEEVNVTWVNHDPEPYYNFVKDKPFTATAVYYKEKWYWYSSTCADLLAEYGRNPVEEIDDGIEIIAWMPLPEPWKGEDD